MLLSNRDLKEPDFAEWKSQKEILYRTVHESSSVLLSLISPQLPESQFMEIYQHVMETFLSLFTYKSSLALSWHSCWWC